MNEDLSEVYKQVLKKCRGKPVEEVARTVMISKPAAQMVISDLVKMGKWPGKK